MTDGIWSREEIEKLRPIPLFPFFKSSSVCTFEYTTHYNLPLTQAVVTFHGAKLNLYRRKIEGPPFWHHMGFEKDWPLWPKNNLCSKLPLELKKHQTKSHQLSVQVWCACFLRQSLGLYRGHVWYGGSVAFTADFLKVIVSQSELHTIKRVGLMLWWIICKIEWSIHCNNLFCATF